MTSNEHPAIGRLVKVRCHIGTLVIPQQSHQKVNGPLNVCIKFGSIRLSSKSANQRRKDGSTVTITYVFNQELEFDLEALPSEFTVQIRSEKQHLKCDVHETLAVEQVFLGDSFEVGEQIRHVLSFSTWAGATLQLQYAVHFRDTRCTSYKKHRIQDDRQRSDDTLSATLSERGLALPAGRGSSDSCDGLNGGQMCDGSTDSEDMHCQPLESASMEELAGSSSLAVEVGPGHHSEPMVISGHECLFCEQAAQTVAAAQHELRHCQRQLHACVERRAQEKSLRRIRNADTEARLMKLFAEKEQLRAENAYLLKCLIDAKVRHAALTIIPTPYGYLFPVCRSLYRWIWLIRGSSWTPSAAARSPATHSTQKPRSCS